MSFAGARRGLQTRGRVDLAAVRFGLCGAFSPLHERLTITSQTSSVIPENII